jgi:DNA-binding XRE family transcriptional regulator
MIQVSIGKRPLLEVKVPKSLYERYYEMSQRQQKNFRSIFMERFNVSRRTIYNWIEGKCTPRSMEQEAIALFFKTTVADIWFNVES